MTSAPSAGVHSGHPTKYSTCPEPACVNHRRRYGKLWRYERAKGVVRRVDATKARLHLASLEGADWSLGAISAQTGLSKSMLSSLRAGQPTISVEAEQRLLALDANSVPGPARDGAADVFVSKVGSVRRIQAMLRMGWPHSEQSARAGVRTAVVLHQRGRWVTRATHDKIADTYRELSLKAGPSERTRQRAAASGYLSPAYWDDIDADPEPDWGGVDTGTN